MREFTFTITDPNGIHARPAGTLVKEAGKYESDILIHFSGKEANAKKLFSVMGLGIKCSDKVIVTLSGTDENIACENLEKFFKSNL